MANKDQNRIKNNQGTSRNGRLLQALLPGSVQVDERNISSLLAFASGFAEKIPYYDNNNERNGNWGPFFEKNISVFLSRIATFDTSLYDHELRTIVKDWEQNRKEYNSTKQELLKRLFLLILGMADQTNEWHSQSLKLRPVGGETQIEKLLEKALKAELSLQLLKLRDLYELAVNQQLIDRFPDFDLSPFKEKTIWNFKDYQLQTPLPGSNEKETADLLVKQLRLVYRRFYFSISYIIDQAPQLLESSLKTKQDHQPHVAMLITFLRLFEYAQQHQNTLTERHLDYYFYHLLKQREKESIPDQANVCFELAEHKESYFLREGTPLLAGVNKDGLESFYQTDRDLTVTKTKIGSLKTIFVSKNAPVGIRSSYRLISNIYAAPVANSKDGLGAPFEESDQGWPTFGEEQYDKAVQDRKMIAASIGFVIASSLFQLQEGEREIDLKFRFSYESISIFKNLIEDMALLEEISVSDAMNRVFSNSIQIFASGAEDWFQIERYSILVNPGEESNYISLKILVATGEPAITCYDDEIHQNDLSTEWPVLKILLNPQESVYIYSFLKNLELEKIDIQTKVKGLKTLSLYSDAGLLDNSAPFLPFGPVPVKNSYLMIGSTELFSKKLEQLEVNIEWNNVPEEAGGFETYYREYKSDIRNDSFKVRLSVLNNYEFRPLENEDRQEVPLFVSDSEAAENLQERVSIKDIDLANLKFKPDYQLRELPEFSNKAKSGFFKLQLSEPSIAFGHSDFPRLFADAVVKNSTPQPWRFFGTAETVTADLPREPFVPVIKRLDISYTAGCSINFGINAIRENELEADDQVYHIHPFGVRNIFKNGKASQARLIPNFDDEGYLLIGLTELKAPQVLTLLFQLEKSKRRFSQAPFGLRWRYLCNNEWKPFRQKQLLFDTTENFTTTGIIGLDIPYDITSDNSVLPSGFFWLCASVKGNLNILGRCKDILTQAVSATWVNNGDQSHYSSLSTLPRIKELAQQVTEIATVHQPYPFYGGKPKEKKNDFYMRVSERLRHKNRAISLWDYEHLVLEQFPEIQQVKCIGPAEGGSMFQAGDVRLIVVPRINGTDLEPKVGYHSLSSIKEYMEERSSPFVNLGVHNPEYEKVKIICSVLFEKEEEKGKGEYLKRLHQEIRDFICPWLKGGEMDLGGKVTKNDLLNFVKERPYIRFVTGLSIVHIINEKEMYHLEDTARTDNPKDVIQASSPWRVLIPVEEHQIDFLDTELFEAPEITSLQKMKIGTDFIILEGEKEIDEAYISDITKDTEEKGEYFIIEGLD